MRDGIFVVLTKSKDGEETAETLRGGGERRKGDCERVVLHVACVLVLHRGGCGGRGCRSRGCEGNHGC